MKRLIERLSAWGKRPASDADVVIAFILIAPVSLAGTAILLWILP